MDEKLQQQILSVLNEVEDMTIATVRPDGYPQATTVTFVNDGLILFFVTTEESQKVQNIDKNNKVSLTINRTYTDWNHIEGLSMGGTATIVSDPEEIEKIGHLVFKKHPDLASFIPAQDGKELAYIRVNPKIISVLSYRKGFGHIDEIEV